MALLETLTFSLAPAIGKAIAAWWLKDASIAVDAAGDIGTLLAQKTEDRIAQRRGQRAFEESGEKVAESLEPLFAEYHLAESSKEAVAERIAALLTSAPVDAVWGSRYVFCSVNM